MTVHAAVVATAVAAVCLALAGSLAACATETQADQGTGGTTPRPSAGGASAGSTAGATATDGSSPTPSPARSTANGLIVFDGDSLTEGFMLEPSQSYPSQAMRLLPRGIRSCNVGVSGQTWPDMLADVTTEVDPLYSSQRDFNIVVAWAGANDLAAGYSAEQIYENARTYCLARRQVGFMVVVSTMYPMEPKDAIGSYETLRLEYNDLLREGWPEFADALVDLAADERLGDDSPATRSDYFIDTVHLNEQGYAVIADAVVGAVRPLVDAAD